MNPLFKNTVGRLPLFRSIGQKPAEPDNKTEPEAPAQPPSPPKTQAPPRRHQPRPQPQPQPQPQPPVAADTMAAGERAKLIAKIDALHERISPEPNLVPPPEL